MQLGVAIICALVIAGVAYFADLPTLAGAHPRWADQVLLSGVIIGTVLAIVTIRLPQKVRAIGFIVLAIISYLVAAYGKSRFAASYAEDTLAGQMWYFGWHAVCTFLVAGVISGTYRQLKAG
ncbi:MAG: hypothetical protein NWQ23_07490 [Yoonia sp.]|uniref:hypothetical protein n=1 Tax=Yoonia sp. TaxID=2212373 RepID=UPI00273E4A84|nr:hypothetical protein [Yoonia sp.]MDP5085248.1 hypothetical protein [Yoonia sp.]